MIFYGLTVITNARETLTITSRDKQTVQTTEIICLMLLYAAIEHKTREKYNEEMKSELHIINKIEDIKQQIEYDYKVD